MAEGYFAYEVRDNGICILRCYGASGVVAIPEQIDGMLVTEVCDYAFAGEMEGEPENASGFPCICGDCLEELYLPRTIRRLGRYIFYNCLRLRKLSFYSNIAFIGAGAFTGCGGLCCLKVRQLAGGSCLREVLQDLKQKVMVECYRLAQSPGDGHEPAKQTTQKQGPKGKAAEEWELSCRLVYPEFFEEAVENTPARIISTQTHGMGIQYRNAFRGTQVIFEEYDRLFATGKYNIDLNVLIEIAISRLSYPLLLSEEARGEYACWLSGHLPEAASYLLRQEMMDDFCWLSQKFISAKDQMDVLLEEAKRQGDAEAVSMLMDAKHRRFPGKEKRFCL